MKDIKVKVKDVKNVKIYTFGDLKRRFLNLNVEFYNIK
jgi:hypothetical protein